MTSSPRRSPGRTLNLPTGRSDETPLKLDRVSLGLQRSANDPNTPGRTLNLPGETGYRGVVKSAV